MNTTTAPFHQPERTCWSCNYTAYEGEGCESCGATEQRPESLPLGPADPEPEARVDVSAALDRTVSPEWREELLQPDDPQLVEKTAVLDAVDAWGRDGKPMTSEAAQVVADAARPPTYRVLEHVDVWIDFELSTEERLTQADKVVEKGDALANAEARLEDAKLAWSERKKSLDGDIATAKREADEARRAYHTGVEARLVKCERRADIPTATIQLVRADGVVHESRPMDEREQAKHCRQGDIADVTGGAVVKAGIDLAPGPIVPLVDSSIEPPTELGQKLAAAIKKDERDASGWPVAWKVEGKKWSVPMGKGNDPFALTAEDVRDLYIIIPSGGDGLDRNEIREHAQQLPLQAISTAMGLLEKKGLAKQLKRGVWVTTPPGSKPAPEPEPGRTDTLPESDVTARPKLAEPSTKADALLADAAGVSAAYVPQGVPS